MKKVYCGFQGTPGTPLLVEPLVSVLKDAGLSEDTLSGGGYKYFSRCPAHVKYFKNTFAVKAIIDVTLTYSEEGGIASLVAPTKDKEWFDNNINANVEVGDYQLVQLEWDWYLFSEEDIEVSQIPATVHVNQFITSTIGVSGTMNISKWFRPLKPAFFMRKNSTVKIAKGDVLFYIKVHSEDPVELVPFDLSAEAYRLSQDCIRVKDHKKKMALHRLYDFFTKANYPAKVMQEIKKNLR